MAHVITPISQNPLNNTMTDSSELISAIFSTAVLFLVFIMIIGLFLGWNINRIADLASSLALPFILGLIVLFAFLEISEVF